MKLHAAFSAAWRSCPDGGSMRARVTVAILVAALVSGCASGRLAGSSEPGSGALPAALPMGAVADLPIGHYIKHVVVIIQENRSFDNLFQGYPGADTQSWGNAKLPSGKIEKITLKPQPFTGHLGKLDLAHGYAAAILEYDNKNMDGFYLANQEVALSAGSAHVPLQLSPPHRGRAVLDDGAAVRGRRQTLCDRVGREFYRAHRLDCGATPISTTRGPWRSSIPRAGTRPGDAIAQAGTTTPTIDTQLHRNKNGPFPCFTRYDTVARLLDNKKLPWKAYAPAIGGPGGIYS